MTPDVLVDALSSICFDSFSNGQLEPNLAGQEYVRAQFDLEDITHKLINTLEGNSGD